MHIDHVTIRTKDLEGTRDFLLQTLDLEERPRPLEIQRRIRGHWLYAGDQPLFHLIPSHGAGPAHAAEAFDHVGIRLEGYAGFRTKLDELGVRYSLMDLPEIDERRVFFSTPGGQLLEAVFYEPESGEQDHD